MTTRSLRRGGSLLLGLAAASLAVAACSTPSNDGGGGDATNTAVASPSPDPSLVAMVPAKIRDSGRLSYGSDASYAPNEFIDVDGDTIIGFDVDLGKAIAAKLGLTGEFTNAKFGTLIVGVENGRFDAGMSSFTINPDRLKEVNMVSYFSAGTAWAAATGNPKGVDPDNACGKVIAVQTATVQDEDITARNQECTRAGNPAIEIQKYDLQTDATTAVVSGKADAMLADSPVIAYALQQTGGKLEQIGEVYDSAPYGIAVAKNNTQFAEAITGAVNALIADGTYGAIVDQWGLQNGAITQAELNPTP